jgi:hypothetical protein
MALSCVDSSFYARVNLSDFDVCRLRSCVRPFDAVDITAGLDEARTLGPNQTSELVSPDSTSGCANFSSFDHSHLLLPPRFDSKIQLCFT